MSATGCRNNKEAGTSANDHWTSSYGQVPFLNGYAEAIAGEHFRYHSPLSETDESLLVSCQL